MADLSPAEPSRRTPVWMRVALGLSLAANLAVAGLVLGAAGRDRWDDRRTARSAQMPAAEGLRRGDRPARGGDPAMALSPYIAALPQADRRAIGREVFGQIRAEGLGLRDLRASVDTVIAGLRADPFVPDAVAAELARQRAALSRLQDLSQAALMDRLGAMSPAERRAFADRLEAGLRRRGGPGAGRVSD